ncbi:MAG TPA: type II toxin-antitoxin system VapC family toxin [Bryobacteraceae bacterium]|nr:type II toxin-antitoxin system VapC family toxin [Bryobacteraceae bacterium]
MIILDTNVISELLRHEPSEEVLRSLRNLPSANIYTTAIAEAEIRFGLAILPRGRRRDALKTQVDVILKEDFAGRILPFDSEAAQAYAQIVAARRAKGRPMSLFDAQIAAIAQTQGATLVTRNARDFDACGLEVINPWRHPV